MTTTTERPTGALAWDAFLETEARRLGYSDPGQIARHVSSVRQHIENYRRTEWPQTVRDLRKLFEYAVPDGLEPHWVAPARAVLWQVQTTNPGRGVKKADDGTWWAPTAGLPIGNAQQLTHWLQKGLRLRPPEHGVDVELLETALPPEDVQGEPETKYSCNRHTQKNIGFATWKGYIQHCRNFRERPEGDPPAEEVEKIVSSAYYCYYCFKGFDQFRQASDHLKYETRKPSRSSHPTILEMQEFVEGVQKLQRERQRPQEAALEKPTKPTKEEGAEQ